jgi:peroxiredoxin (alkyl hydroperoxide reductase subunit C)
MNHPKKELSIMCLVTKEAPDFEAEAVMANNSFEKISLKSLHGKYVLIFFYPLDFTFVCPSEILAFNSQTDELKKRNCELLGISVDSVYTHLAWKNTPVNQGGIGNIDFPLVSDMTKKISNDYGVLLEDGVSLRGLFLIDKEGIVRHQLINDLPLGRNVEEALRIVDALQFTEEHGDVCPANWRPGEDAMTPTPEGVAEYLTKHG